MLSSQRKHIQPEKTPYQPAETRQKKSRAFAASIVIIAGLVFFITIWHALYTGPRLVSISREEDTNLWTLQVHNLSLFKISPKRTNFISRYWGFDICYDYKIYADAEISKTIVNFRCLEMSPFGTTFVTDTLHDNAIPRSFKVEGEMSLGPFKRKFNVDQDISGMKVVLAHNLVSEVKKRS